MVYCSQGHHNPLGNRFCQTCGQEIQQPVTGEISAGTVLGDRYRIVKQLGQGGFGRTYLAEDINRFNEQCVLKEFAPKLHGTSALKKAEELFTREAGVLYKFQHPQIPQFRELSRFQVGSDSGLFLVQDYVAGQTYQALLNHRQSQGYRFNEAEVLELIRQLLPVLDYIHSQGVIHRDISPDNLILRSSDRLPVLIDFGGVKQVAASIEQSQSAPGTKKTKKPKVATRVGKLGYAPEEQMLLGIVHPHSDLYALAVTVLVLLTGKAPPALFDSHNMCWVWQKFVTVSSPLTIVLNKMLSRQQGDRFQSATEVLQALGISAPAPSHSPNLPAQLATQLPSQLPHSAKSATASSPVRSSVGPTSVSLPPNLPIVPPTAPPKPATHKRVWGLGGKLLLLLLLAIGGARGGWWLTNFWLQSDYFQNASNDGSLFESDNPEELSELAGKTEQELKTELQDQRKALGINQLFFNELVNQAFYRQYPEKDGKILTRKPEDEIWRSRWSQVGLKLLVKLESLSPKARDRLGTYNPTDFRQWQQSLKQRNLNSQSLDRLTDAQFFAWFPNQEGRDFINLPIGQVWYAIAFDKFTDLQNQP